MKERISRWSPKWSSFVFAWTELRTVTRWPHRVLTKTSNRLSPPSINLVVGTDGDRDDGFLPHEQVGMSLEELLRLTNVRLGVEDSRHPQPVGVIFDQLVDYVALGGTPHGLRDCGFELACAQVLVLFHRWNNKTVLAAHRDNRLLAGCGLLLESRDTFGLQLIGSQ